MCACVRACVCVCVRACVRACVRPESASQMMMQRLRQQHSDKVIFSSGESSQAQLQKQKTYRTRGGRGLPEGGGQKMHGCCDALTTQAYRSSCEHLMAQEVPLAHHLSASRIISALHSRSPHTLTPPAPSPRPPSAAPPAHSLAGGWQRARRLTSRAARGASWWRRRG